MTTISKIGIGVAILAAVLLVVFLIRKAMTGKDIITGVDNDKIQKAAEAVGIPKTVANQIAQSPDSAAAARSIGVPAVIATTIANGIVPVQPGDSRIISYSNTAGHCPAGSSSYPVTTGGYACISNTN